MHSLVRQSPVSFDAAASLTHGHYVLELHGSLPGRSGAQGGGSSSTAAGEVVFATDHLWFSPPGNVQPQVFNDTVLMNGLQHLIQRTAAGGKDRSSDGGGSGGGGSSGGGSGSSGSSISRSSSSGGGRRRLTLDFLVGSTSAWQQRHVREYVGSSMGGDASWRQRTLLVLSLCIWEGTDVRPA